MVPEMRIGCDPPQLQLKQIGAFYGHPDRAGVLAGKLVAARARVVEQHRALALLARGEGGKVGQLLELAVIRPVLEVLHLHLLLAVGFVADVPEGHRAMVALQHERADRFLIGEAGGAGRAAHLYVLVHGHPVVHHLHEAGVGSFAALGIKAGCPEHNPEVLPQAGGAAGV